MHLEDYFDFLAPSDIRIKGSRIGIETVLYAFVHSARTAEEIARDLPSVSLEQVYATILYYLHNKDEVARYLTDWIEFGRTAREEQRRNPPPGVRRLIEIKAERSTPAAGQ